MPLNFSSLNGSVGRAKVLTALLAALTLALLFAQPDGAALAQRRRAQQSNANARQDAQKTEKPKRVFVGRGADTAQGSRVSIKSDETLKDYSAYRSGDRFYVVLPKADAGAVARGGSGKGYSDMQVQQRGNDVVVSYRVQPGAKPRVEQKFNRLDVVFDVPEGVQPAASSNRAATPPAAENTNAGATGQAAGRPAAANTGNAAAAGQTDKRTAPPEANAARPGEANAAEATTPAAVAEQPSSVAPVGPDASVTTTPEQTPATTPAETQVAQAEPPTTIAPITTGDPATNVQTGTSLGTFLVNNWPIPLFLALIVIGLGLVFVARRSSAASSESAEGVEGVTAAKLDGPRAARLKDASADAKPSASDVSGASGASGVVPVVAASTLAAGSAAAGEAREEAAEDEVWAEELALADEHEASEPAAAGSAVEDTLVEEASVEEVTAEAAALEAPDAVESGSAQAASGLETTAIEAAPASAGGDAETAGVAAGVTGIAPIVELDPDNVQAETKRLLEGEQYNPAVIGSSDSMARQLIAAELLAALSGRNAQRRERARAAFVEHGYFDEKTRDLREAEASAERAAAARSLAIVGEQSATPLLIDALEDRSVDVRRAAVEALGAIRDPSAVAPLEALIRREKKERIKISNRVIRHAIDACREAEAEMRAAPAAPVEAAVAEAAEVEAPHVAESAEVEAAPETVEAVTGLEPFAGTAEEVTADEPAPVVVEGVAAETFESAEPVMLHGAAEEVTAPTPVEEVAAPSEVEPAFETDAAAESFAEVEARPVVEEAEPFAETVEIAPFVGTAQPEISGEPAAEVTPVADVTEVEEAREFDAAPVAESVAETETVEAEVVETEAVEEVSEVEPAFAAGEVAEVEETFTVEEEHRVFGEVPAVDEAALFGEEAAPVAEHAAETAAVETTTTELAPFAEELSSEFTVVEETGIQPFAETDTAVPAGAFAGEATPAQDFAAAEPEAEAVRASLFDESAAAERREVVEASAVEEEKGIELAGGPEHVEVAAGEWIDLDITETDASVYTGTVETNAPVFESSSGESLSAAAPVAPPEVASETFGGDERAIERAGATAEEEFETAEAFRPAAFRDEEAAPTLGYAEKGVAPFDEYSTVPASIQQRLASDEPGERAAAITELSRVDTDEAFQQICAAFDDDSKEVRGAAARALFDLREDRAESFTRALREATPERRRQIGSAIATSGLATDAVSQLTGESREKTYEAFSLLFLMAKAGEVQPLIRAIEAHPNSDVRLAVVKLLALSGQKEILPAFRRLAVRGSLPTEVRSAVMEAIYQISSNQPTAA